MNSYERNPAPPYSLQVELSEGCNLYCNFCGLQGIRTKKNKNYKFMDIRTLALLCTQVKVAGWDPRIELALHGEPTMHPNFIQCIATIRDILPEASIMMTSNGGGFLKAPLTLIYLTFDAGLNCLALDNYESVNIVPKIRAALEDDFLAEYQVGEYPADKTLSPNKKWNHRDKQLIYVEDISKAATGTHSTLTNHAGCAFPLTDAKQGKRCAKPFREISVRWDGDIAICCEDWRGTYKCGSIHYNPIEEIWKGEAFRTARRFLYQGNRVAPPCQGCNATGYRLGFLPDRKGKEDLPKPTAADKRLWYAATSGAPYTTPVLRPWEEDK